jgi:hypothetical protein
LYSSRINAFFVLSQSFSYKPFQAAYFIRGQRYVMRPFTIEIIACDFAFAASHRLTTSSLLAGTLNSAAAFSMAAGGRGRTFV